MVFDRAGAASANRPRGRLERRRSPLAERRGGWGPFEVVYGRDPVSDVSHPEQQPVTGSRTVATTSGHRCRHKPVLYPPILSAVAFAALVR